MSYNAIPVEYMRDVPPVPRFYPTRRDNDAATGRQGTVDLDHSTERYGRESGTDGAELGLSYAAGQRQAARVDESRAALTTRAPDSDDVMAPPGTGPASPVFLHSPFAMPPVRRSRWRR